MLKPRRAFTLIELLVVVVIIGILAAIAIPKFANTKGKANVAAMKSDLRNLAVAEESYFYEHRTYTTVLDSLSFRTSPGVILTFLQGDATGWSAISTHPQAYPHTCAIFYGGATAIAPATVEGEVACQ
jgi:prepilin-type N-terminal cleavage/methylation domain-containing protein